MKFPLSWLRDYLDTGLPLPDLSAKLTSLGLEVEGIHDAGVALKPFIVARVTEAHQHPDADRLRVCTVDTGSGTLQVVCGAPNARGGIMVALARPGDVIPSTGQTLKAGVIRGVESQGMLCSGKELGLSDEQDGIMELPGDAQVGQSLADALHLDDPVIEVAITPNRADCASVYGIARDLAAAGAGTLKPLETTRVPGHFHSPLSVSITEEAREACPLFVGRMIRGVTNQPSPAWLQDRLKAVGLRPISALVDVTNYITLGMGRPLHVFDAGKVEGNLTVRFAHEGETLNALNDKAYALKPHHLVIADHGGVESLAGIMGGAETGCDDATTTVFLEVALFDPRTVAATGRELQITSDARYRFERGLDPAFVFTAAEMATRLILELCGGEASELVVAGSEPHWRRELTLRSERAHTLGGVEIPPEQQLNYLEALGCKFEGTTIIPPSWRGDLRGEADLVEEVLRLHGYDNIPATPLPRTVAVTKPGITPAQRRPFQARRLLAARGLHEAVTFSFMSSSVAKRFAEIDPSLHLQNPISADLDAMRGSILPNLIEAAARNAARGTRDVGLFEVGPVYSTAGQGLVAALLRCGDYAERSWSGAARRVTAFDAKADVQALLAQLGAPATLGLEATAPAWYHPGRCGTLKVGHRKLAEFGELHPRLAEAMGCPSPCVVAEVFFDTLPEVKRKGTEKPLLALSPFQPVERDFAFVVANDISAERIVKAVRSADKTLIGDVAIFDVYNGKGVEDGHKSVAVGVTLTPDQNLTDADIEAVGREIVRAVGEATGAKLRG